MGTRGWKGERFLRMLGNFDFHLPHTFVRGFDTMYTGTINGKPGPKQMDYMATTAPPKWITRAARGDYDATTTDHFPLVLSLIAKHAMPRNEREGEEADECKTHRVGAHGARLQ
jgi:hypothetical protein